jgi:hypothetical protein
VVPYWKERHIWGEGSDAASYERSAASVGKISPDPDFRLYSAGGHRISPKPSSFCFSIAIQIGLPCWLKPPLINSAVLRSPYCRLHIIVLISALPS